VGSGEVLALLGPNGAGKTTVLRTLAGLASVDGGSIVLDGVVLDDPVRGVLVEPDRRSVGMMFQDHLLFDGMSVLENVAFGLRARRTDRNEARTRAREWLERVGLADRAAARPRELSGGQAQRVALARALATDPRLLLLDEPLAALDASTRAGVRQELRRHLGAFAGACVLVTHDPVDAWTLADRIAVVEAGRLVQTGTPTDITARPRTRWVADLVGVNLVVGSVRDGVLVSHHGATVVVADAAPGPSLAVIRPRSIVVSRSAPEGTSARNCWSGTVTDVDRLGTRVRVSIAGAVPLVAEITEEAFRELHLVPGDAVHASVKATEIEVSPV
jgi:molybdate transport system ATP-binding protein